MSILDHDKALLDALRQVGVVIPDAKPIPQRRDVEQPTALSASSPFIRRYWLVSNGSFSTVVNWRDASSVEEALKIAREDKMQAWYINDLSDALTVKEISRNDYIDWLRRGVR